MVIFWWLFTFWVITVLGYRELAVKAGWDIKSWPRLSPLAVHPPTWLKEEMEQTEFRHVPPNHFSHVTETCQLKGPCLGLIFAVIFFRPLVGKHPGNAQTQAEDFPKLNTELMLHRFKNRKSYFQRTKVTHFQIYSLPQSSEKGPTPQWEWDTPHPCF